MNRFIKLAIEEASNGLKVNEGGPFGAVIVRNGEVIAKAHNEVLASNDPTAHAEILAIRWASQKLDRFNLSDCEIYTTCEPCPMCLAAIYWARIPKVYYGCTKKDAAQIGFDDEYIYDVIKEVAEVKKLESIQIDRSVCLKLFEEWKSNEDRVGY